MFGVFEVITPDDTQPEDVLRGSGQEIPVDATQRIIITVTDEPESFVVMDIMYDSDVPTRVIMFTSDNVLVEAQEEPVSPESLAGVVVGCCIFAGGGGNCSIFAGGSCGGSFFASSDIHFFQRKQIWRAKMP